MWQRLHTMRTPFWKKVAPGLAGSGVAINIQCAKKPRSLCKVKWGEEQENEAYLLCRQATQNDASVSDSHVSGVSVDYGWAESFLLTSVTNDVTSWCNALLPGVCEGPGVTNLLCYAWAHRLCILSNMATVAATVTIRGQRAARGRDTGQEMAKLRKDGGNTAKAVKRWRQVTEGPSLEDIQGCQAWELRVPTPRVQEM